MRNTQSKPFALEVDLCAAFISVLPDTWVSYPETAGWDILLVRKSDGYQVGIQAKLKFNIAVITQCLEGPFVERSGPDYRAVLVPSTERRAETICSYIGIGILSVRSGEIYDQTQRKIVKKWQIYPDLPKDDKGYLSPYHWFDWMPSKRCTLPEYIPDVMAGSSSPIQLTQWKIAAIKLAIIMEKRGFITRADFKHVGIDHRRWLPSGAGMVAIDETNKGRYIKGEGWPNLISQHPKNWVEIETDYDEWAPKVAI